MSEQLKENKKQEKRPDDWLVNGLDEEARENLLGFFDLLVKVDRRVNPQLYQKHNDDN